MTNTAAVYKFINDQTLLYINEGYTETEIANMIQLPKELRKSVYPPVLWHSFTPKAVYEKYMGWYDGNPVHLAELTPSDYAQKLVEYFGDGRCGSEKAKRRFCKGRISVLPRSPIRWFLLIRKIWMHVIFVQMH